MTAFVVFLERYDDGESMSNLTGDGIHSVNVIYSFQIEILIEFFIFYFNFLFRKKDYERINFWVFLVSHMAKTVCFNYA